MTAIEELASSLAALGAQDLSEPVHTKLQWHVVDAIGAWLAASRTPEGAALVAFRRRIRAAGHGAEDVPMDVATGCALARLSEIDDIHLASMTTPGSIVIPGALTLARAWQTDPSDVTAAMIAGYEAMSRLGGTIGGAHVLYRGIWPTYVAAPFGVAAVAARRSEEHTSELQSRGHLVCRLLLEKKKQKRIIRATLRIYRDDHSL